MLHYEVKSARTNLSLTRETSDRNNRTIVCLHGFLESSNMWANLSLEKYGQLLLVDLPGHGKSELDHIDSMQAMANAVQEVLMHEKVSSYDVIGHSMGGYVALELKSIDENCNQLILLNSNVWSDNEQKQFDRQRVAKLVQTKKERFISEAIPNLFQFPERHLNDVQRLISEASAMSSEAIGRASLAMSQRSDFSEMTLSGELDVIVIQGLHDSVADKIRMEQIMQQQMNNFHVIDTGHMAHIEGVELVGEVLEKVIC